MAEGLADARETARRVLRRVHSDRAFAARALDSELERSRLDPRDRALATELVYGVLRHRSRIDRALAALMRPGSKLSPAVRTALRVAAYQLLWLDRVPDHAAIDDAVTAARRAGGERIAGFANAVLRRLARDGEPPVPNRADAAAFAEVACSLPRWIVDRLRVAVGDRELADAADAMARAARLAIRVNVARATPADVTAALTGEGATVDPVPELDDALWVTGLGAPDASPSFARGLWTVQDTGAQRVARLASPRPGEHWLDACAGLGGKALHLAQLARDVHVDAADLARGKLDRLAAAAARLGVDSVRGVAVDLTDSDATAASLRDAYDGVLLDAPCSGLGVLRRHPEAKWRMDADTIDELAVTQAALLDTVVDCVAPGGVLVYAVCTFTVEEGPRQVARIVAEHPELIVVDELHTWPHLDGGDAFYAARLVRRDK